MSSLGKSFVLLCSPKIFPVIIAKDKWQCHNFAKNKLWKRITFHVTWFDQQDALVGQWGNCHWFKPHTSSDITAAWLLHCPTGWEQWPTRTIAEAVQNKSTPASETTRHTCCLCLLSHVCPCFSQLCSITCISQASGTISRGQEEGKPQGIPFLPLVVAINTFKVSSPSRKAH